MPKMLSIHSDIPVAIRAQEIDILQVLLANSIDIHQSLKVAHWSVRGANFIGLHKLFDEIVDAVEDYMDKFAERVVQLGGYARGSLKDAVAASQLPDLPLDTNDWTVIVTAVTACLSAYAAQGRAAIDQFLELDDQVTANMTIDIVQGADKWTWFVSAHLPAEVLTSSEESDAL